MLSYNDQYIHEAHNDSVCRQLSDAARKHNAIQAAVRSERGNPEASSLSTPGRAKGTLRYGLLILVFLLAMVVSVTAASAAEAYGAEVMGSEVMGNEVMGIDAYGAEVMGADAMGTEVMGNEAMGEEAAPEAVEPSSWLSRLQSALGTRSSGSAPRGINYY